MLSKHNKREKLLHESVGTETELEMNIIHEAFDVLFNQMVYAYNCQVKIMKGRLSNILIIEFCFDTRNVYKLVVYESSTVPSKKMNSEMIYINQVPKWVINTETFGNGDGNFLKISINDLRYGNKEDLVVQKTEEKRYTRLNDLSSSMLMSEERFSLFRLVYGAPEADIDFSTYKFRKIAQPKQGVMLL